MEKLHKLHNTAHFSVLSISYEKADADVRSKFTFFDDHVKSFVSSISENKIGDAFVVSTCNRTEIYSTSSNYLLIAEEFCKATGVTLSEFLQFANIFTREAALNHLFRVAGGLESQILGDFEIIGQIKKAYNRFKKEKKRSNPYLERAINSAIQISKKIKNQTALSSGAASVSYAAVHYIMTQSENLHHANILLVGTGEIGQNTVENLLKHAPDCHIKIANRTTETAEKIAGKYNIPYIPYQNLETELKNTDILIVATGASEPIIHKKHIPEDKKMLILDLSIPNNVAREVEENKAVTLINVDAISKAIAETIEQRKKEIPKAEEIIKEMTKAFIDWEKKRKHAPNIHHFKAMLKNIERNEMHNIHRKHRYIKIDDMELTDKIIQKITNRFAKYIIDNPLRSEEITKLMHEILVQQAFREFQEKH